MISEAVVTSCNVDVVLSTVLIIVWPAILSDPVPVVVILAVLDDIEAPFNKSTPLRVPGVAAEVTLILYEMQQL